MTAEGLGHAGFKAEYNLKYAYLSGAMYHGISSPELVIKMGNAGMLGFLGTGGLSLSAIEQALQVIQKALNQGEPYGMNLLNSPLEDATVDLYLRYGIRVVEAAAYLQMTPALIKYRLKGLAENADGSILIHNRIIAKVSRPEVAEAFLSPPPARRIQKLLESEVITEKEAQMASKIPMADDLCVEADSGGHTDHGVLSTLMPAMIALRDRMRKKHQYPNEIRVGAAGGIGTPSAAAAAFVLGADFILTGSINQCTVEARTSEPVKNLLQQMNVQDTEYAPAGDMFEMGAKVQVLSKGVFFPARANKLFALYQHYNSIDEIDEKTQKQIQERYFNKRFDEIYEECRRFYSPEEIQRAEEMPKRKMALIFRWYFGYSSRLALEGNEQQRVNYQIHCGPALGAFNQLVKGTDLENWQNRHVDAIGIYLMEETAKFLTQTFHRLGS